MQSIAPRIMTMNVLPDTMQHTVPIAASIAVPIAASIAVPIAVPIAAPRLPPLVPTSNSRNRLFPLPQSLLRNIIRLSQPNK